MQTKAQMLEKHYIVSICYLPQLWQLSHTSLNFNLFLIKNPKNIPTWAKQRMTQYPFTCVA
jgi:hypothetical protein